MEFEMPPYVCLRVRGLAALRQPAKNGPMLAHCGGPGSGRDCAQSMSSMNFDIDGRHAILSDFDLLSIDQRGVNTSADRYEQEEKWGEVKPCPFNLSGEAIHPFPTIYCNEIAKYIDKPQKVMKLLTGEVNKSTHQSDWKTYVYPIWRKGNIPYADLAPLNETWLHQSIMSIHFHVFSTFNDYSLFGLVLYILLVYRVGKVVEGHGGQTTQTTLVWVSSFHLLSLTILKETFVRWYYRLVKLEHSLCYESERYKIKAPNGRIYNTLQFASTHDCAQDIETLQT